MLFRKTSILAFLALPLLAGCHSTTPAQALAPQLAANDPGAQLQFWHALPERKAVSNEEAFHALLLFVDGQDDARDYDQRVQRLKEKHMVSAGFNGTAAEPLRRGTLAVALAQALSIKGGLSMRLFGPHDRYAVRELEYAGVYPPSSPQQTFSGQEFLGIIGRAEDYQRARTEGDLAVEAPVVPAPAAGAPAAAGAADGGV